MLSSTFYFKVWFDFTLCKSCNFGTSIMQQGSCFKKQTNEPRCRFWRRERDGIACYFFSGETKVKSASREGRYEQVVPYNVLTARAEMIMR